MRQDKRRRIINLKNLNKLKVVLKKAREKPTLENVRTAASVIAQAAKKKIIHGNKADRLKSRLANLAKKTVSRKAEKPVKKTKRVKKKNIK